MLVKSERPVIVVSIDFNSVVAFVSNLCLLNSTSYFITHYYSF